MTIDPKELERLTRAYGEELFARIDPGGPMLFTPGWWDERLMDWSMSDEAIKVQLFRFIDALPLLHTPEDVSRHLREYFAEARGAVPRTVGRLVGWLPRRGIGARFLTWNARTSAARLARRFIAGA